MAISARQKQKRLERKNKKRKIAKKSILNIPKLGNKARSYSKYPIHECLVPDGLFGTGIGEVIVTRKMTNGNIVLSAFIVDVYCLGIKDAMFRVISEYDYENVFKKGFMSTHEGQFFEKTHPSCVKKLVEGAVDYANNLGFSPHRDYHNSIGLLATIDSSACPVKYEYGKDGKPFYIQGPHETPEQIERIINKLHNKCGDGGYNFMTAIGEEFFSD